MSGAGRAVAPLDRPGTRLGALFLFSAAMGWLEAVVVVYIRGLVGIARVDGMPPADEVLRRIGSIPWLLPTEQSREVATIAMLAAVALLAAPQRRARFGAFLISFGLWDIVYYVGLYVLLGWPPSLGAMDVLFLIPPGPWWHQPVWLPIAISGVMIATGVKLFLSTERVKS